MAYVPVPKALTKVKTKVMFNLTKRQLICFGLGIVIGLPIFFLTKSALGTSVSAMLMIIVMLPCFMLALYEKHGQPLEKVLKQYINARFIRPKVRPYRTENIYSAMMKQSILDKEVEKIAGRKDKIKKAKTKNSGR